MTTNPSVETSLNGRSRSRLTRAGRSLLPGKLPPPTSPALLAHALPGCKGVVIPAWAYEKITDKQRDDDVDQAIDHDRDHERASVTRGRDPPPHPGGDRTRGVPEQPKAPCASTRATTD